MAHLRFKAGDLVEVSSRLTSFWPYRPQDPNRSLGPGVFSTPSLYLEDIRNERAFLVLKDADNSGWHTNRKIYVEIMTSSGPKVAWADTFKYKKGKIDDCL